MLGISLRPQSPGGLLYLSGLTVIMMSCSASGYLAPDGRLLSPPSYFISAPKRIRPDQQIQVFISLLDQRYPEVTIKASINRDKEQLTGFSETFTEPTTRMAFMRLPFNAENGNYTLVLEGLTGSGKGGILFRNVTKLEFLSKHVTVFIQTDKRVYQKRSQVYFRVYAYLPNMKPVPSGSIDIYMKNGAGHIVRRWLSQQVRNGYFALDMRMDHPAKHGYWAIEVVGWGHKYRHTFQTINHFPTRHDIDIDMPEYIFDKEYSLGGTAMANFTYSGLPVKGNASVQLEIQPPDWSAEYPTITRKYPMMHGGLTFQFPLEEIRNRTLTELDGTRLLAHVTVDDWFGLEAKTMTQKSMVFRHGYHITYLGGRIRTFKPGQVMPVYVAVVARDGSKFNSSVNNMVYIHGSVRTRSGTTRMIAERSYVIPDNSIVRFLMTPDKDDELIRIRSAYGDSDRTYIELVAYRHYTESDQYLAITSSSLNIRTDTYIVFTVRVSTYVPRIYYQIVSKGNILTGSWLDMKSRQHTFSLAASRDMLPEATILVHALLHDGEVLADSLNFHVDGVNTKDAVVRLNMGKDFTRDTVEINAFADKSTFMAFYAEDNDFARRGVHNFLTKEWVEDDLMEYCVGVNTSFHQMWWTDEFRRLNDYYSAPSYAVDTNTTFDYAGLIVFTDANLVRFPGAYNCNHTKGHHPCNDGSCYLTAQRCDGVWQCEDGTDEMGCPEPSQIMRPDKPFNDLKWDWLLWDHLDDRLWGWKHHYTMPYGRIDFSLNSPIRPARWDIQGIALSTEGGIAFNDPWTQLYTARSFYIEVETPKKAVRGEQIGIQVSIFNFFHQNLEILIMLTGSNDYRFIDGEDFGVVSSYNPRTISGDVQTMVYMEAGKSQYIHFPILPVKYTGSFKFTIIADSCVRRQVVTKSMSIAMDGVTNIYHTPFLIDLKNKGSVVMPHLDIPVPERFILPQQRQHLYVPGSAKADVTVVGDVAGPYVPYYTGKNIFGRIHGNGADYVFNVGINMYWLRFLDRTDQLDAATLDQGLYGINRELQQVYAYIINDEGMAQRRSKRPKSVWVTALTLDVLSQTKYYEWEHTVFIDTEILNRMVIWLVAQQNSTTGSFPFTELISDPKMQSKMTDEYGVQLNISLTAHAAIGLQEASKQTSGDARSLADLSKRRAADYLAAHFDRLTDPFEVCIVTYALLVTDHITKEDAFRKMRTFRRAEEFTYWSRDPIPPIEYEMINNIPYLRAREYLLPVHAAAIEGTAYALLVYVRNNWITEAEPIMKWLNTQRNHLAGFDSSQDTMWAMKAIFEYADREMNRAFYNMRIQSVAPSSPNWTANFAFDYDTVQLVQKASVPVVWGSVSSTAQGTGYALMQLETKVNVEYEYQMRRPLQQAFDLQLWNFRMWGRNFSNWEVDVCIRWLRTDLAPTSGNAIMEFDIPTGWFVRKQELRKYQRVGRIQSQRSRYASQKVVLYIDYIDDNFTCWHFPAERWYPVANLTIQHKVSIYSSYSAALQNTTLYTTYPLFHNHICRVCGSFQCPYCPSYNGGSTTSVTLPYRIIALVTVLFVCLLHEQHWHSLRKSKGYRYY